MPSSEASSASARSQLVLVVDLHQRIHAELPCRFREFGGLAVVQGGHDEQDAVRAERARLRHLIGVEHEILAQHGKRDGRVCLREIAVFALEVGLVRQHGEAGRAAAGVGGGQGRRVEIGADEALAGRGLLQLGDEGRAATVGDRAKRSGEAAWRLGRPRPLSQRRLGDGPLALGNVVPLVVANPCEDVAHRPAALPASARRVPAADFDEPVERGLRLAAVYRLGGMANAFPQIGGAPGDDERRGGIEQHDVARRAGFAAQHAANDAGVLRRVAALQVLGRGARQAGVLGRDLEAADRAAVELDDRGRPRGGELVGAVAAMDDPDALGAEIAQDLGHGLRPLGVEHADQLAPGAGRVGERAQQVEDGPRAELDPRRPHVAHGAVVPGRHEEADPGLPQRFADERHVRVDGDAEGGEQVGRARARRERAVAVLGDGHAAACGHQRRSGRDVEGALRVAARAAGVDGSLGRVDA